MQARSTLRKWLGLGCHGQVTILWRKDSSLWMQKIYCYDKCFKSKMVLLILCKRHLILPVLGDENKTNKKITVTCHVEDCSERREHLLPPFPHPHVQTWSWPVQVFQGLRRPGTPQGCGQCAPFCGCPLEPADSCWFLCT